jgi:hypothetical protein
MRLRKDKRQKTNMQKAGVGWARHSEAHNSPIYLQQVYYIQWQQEVERQFSGERV